MPENTSQPAADWPLLARAVITRRVALGFRSRREFSEIRQFGVRTLNDIETARKSNYHRSTLAALEGALDWAPGSVETVLRGGQPTAVAVVPESEGADYVSYRPDGGPSLRDATKDELLAEMARRMRDEADGR